MEAWRTKLVTSFPDNRAEWEDSQTTIYDAFMELNTRCQNAHEVEDRPLIEAIFEFAAWCSRQPEKDLWNAAGVSFYEHVIEDLTVLRDFPRLVPPDVFHEISELLRWRMGDAAFEKLKSSYGEQRSRKRPL